MNFGKAKDGKARYSCSIIVLSSCKIEVHHFNTSTEDSTLKKKKKQFEVLHLLCLVIVFMADSLYSLVYTNMKVKPRKAQQNVAKMLAATTR